MFITHHLRSHIYPWLTWRVNRAAFVAPAATNLFINMIGHGGGLISSGGLIGQRRGRVG